MDRIKSVKELEPIGGEHGISSVYPTLRDILDFKSGKFIVSRGYPRFVLHPYVSEISRMIAPGKEFLWPVSSSAAARFIMKHYCRLPGERVRIDGDENAAVLSVTSREDFEILYEDVRNTGFTLSSRKAKRILSKGKYSLKSKIFVDVKNKIAGYEKKALGNKTYLFQSGMAATFISYLAAFRPDRPETLVIGNPYYDTRQLFIRFAERNGYPGPRFIETNQDWEAYLTPETGIIFSELPTNPLLRVADIEKVIRGASKRGIRVLADNTLGTSFNTTPLEYGADFVIQSTTKFLNGKNNHLGGVVMTGPNAGTDLENSLDSMQQESGAYLDIEEAEILNTNLDGFPERMDIINRNALTVAEFLKSSETIDQVYYPLLKNHPDFEIATKMMNPGAGGVVSFILKRSSLENAAAFYDNCTIPGKGPSLGGEETLLCPITLLTFFNANDSELRAMGLDRFLMRLSVGIEDARVIMEHLNNGLRNIKY